MLKLYDYTTSGHAYQARLMMSLLKLRHESYVLGLREKDLEMPSFKPANPLQQVVVLQDGDFLVWCGNAILIYLARRYGPEWYPSDAMSVARVQEWLETSSKQSAETTRFGHLKAASTDKTEQRNRRAQSHDLLLNVEIALDGRHWLALNHISVADISMYPCIVSALRAGVFLSQYPNVQDWLARIETLSGFIERPKDTIAHLELSF